MERTYLAIDLKSFYASVECVERGLDPLDTYLVVADESRTDKTICLAVTPAMKALGVPGRPRLFEVAQQIRSVNSARLRKAPGHCFACISHSARQLSADARCSLEYVVARPRMELYMEYSARIYQIYLKYIAPEDLHVYSIDEVFMDITDYLPASGLDAPAFARKIMLEVLRETGITATAGIGSNLYLCKIAMDIWAKHIPPDENGVRIAQLDEASYRRMLWSHRPLTDFWRVGHGYARKLEANGMFTMGDVARQSLLNEDLLYRLFGVNAELLIDHAWGWEPCTLADIKAYRPESTSIGSGQVLSCAYSFDKARIVVREMADALALQLVEQHLTAGQVVLDIGYDQEGGEQAEAHAIDRYGRRVPRPAHGSAHLIRQTSSARLIIQAVLDLYDRVVDPRLMVRRITLTATQVADENARHTAPAPPVQLDMFTDYEDLRRQQEALDAELAKEKSRQEAVLSIKKRYGRNAILMGTSLLDGATAMDRNQQIGGHKA